MVICFVYTMDYISRLCIYFHCLLSPLLCFKLVVSSLASLYDVALRVLPAELNVHRKLVCSPFDEDVSLVVFVVVVVAAAVASVLPEFSSRIRGTLKLFAVFRWIAQTHTLTYTHTACCRRNSHNIP